MILDEYAKLLTALGIRFTTNNGFSVWIDDLMVSVSASRSGKVSLSSYIGIVDYGKRNADKLTAALTMVFPEYKIYPDKYSGYYEIEIEQNLLCKDICSLHEKVITMTDVLIRGFQIGTEMFGTEMFHT